MSDELTKLPLKIDGWQVFFDSNNQSFCLKQNDIVRLDFNETTDDFPSPTTFIVECCPTVTLEVSLINDLARWLSESGVKHTNCRTRLEGEIAGAKS